MMKTFGIPATRELVSLPLDQDGNPDPSILNPDPTDESWTAPEVVPLVKIEKPAEISGKISVPEIVWFSDRVERQWITRDITPEEYKEKFPVPEVVQSHQLFAALSRAGISESSVQAVIDSMPDGQAKTESDIAFRRAPMIRRDHPIALAIAQALNLTEPEIDEIYRVAETI